MGSLSGILERFAGLEDEQSFQLFCDGVESNASLSMYVSVTAQSRGAGRLTLSTPASNSPNPLSNLVPKSLLAFRLFSTSFPSTPSSSDISLSCWANLSRLSATDSCVRRSDM